MNFDYNILDEGERIIYTLRALYGSFGYKRYKMGKFEEYDLYSRNKDFLVSDRVITFTDTNGKLMALKPDVTLSIIKNNKDLPDEVQKIFYNENIYRVSKGTGSFREIMQTGLECFGKIDNTCISEVLDLAVRSLSSVKEESMLEVSDLNILSAVIGSITESSTLREELFPLIGEKNIRGIGEKCLSAGIPEERTSALRELISLHGPLEKTLPRLREICANTAENEFSVLDSVISGIGEKERKKIQIDFSVIGDINYYNGIIFNGFISGVPGKVLSGGQYDRLMEKMNRKSKAIGFAVYLDQLERISI